MKKLYVLVLLLVIFASSASVAQITVKFKAPAEWTSVALYCWIPGSPEPLGGWPGVVLTETDGWYSYTFDASFTGGNLILNNNGGGKQTVSFPTSSSTCFQTVDPVAPSTEFGLTAIPCTAPGITVKFKKPVGWTEVHLYTYEPGVTGGWPGATLTETDGWYTYTFDVAYTGGKLIFNNGAAEQTEDYVLAGDVCLQSSAAVNAGGKYDVSVAPCAATPGFTVKFKKPATWTTVNMYTWGPEAVGGWPGVALTEANGWYSYTFDNTFTAGNVIFNNGATEQTVDYALSSDACLQAASAVNTEGKYDVNVVSCTTPGFTVKFKKPESWTSVNMYTWGPEAVGGWPGVALTEVDGWYSYTFNDTFITGNVIFNNGTGEQTVDYGMTADVCLQAASVLNAGGKYDVSVVPCTAPGFTVKFQKPESWTTVSLYTWGPEVLGGWPGESLTETDGWYSVTFDATFTGANLIFNNTSGEQTEDYAITGDVCLKAASALNANNKYDVTVVPCEVVGIADVKPNSLTIYPNPIAERMNFNGFENIEKVIVQTVTGKNIITDREISKQGSLDVKTLKSGVYIVRIIYSDGRQIAKKIVKM